MSYPYPPPQQQQQQQTTYVTVLGPTDVLLGRGSGPNDHEGNVQFRKYVAERKHKYMATNHRLTKAKIAREIVDLVSSAGGRFLKKLNEDQEVYEVVSDETVMEKAKQALRQNAGKKDAMPMGNAVSSANTAVRTDTNTRPPPQTSTELPVNLDLEPIPFTDAGYSGPIPTQNDITAVWEQPQLQQQQQQQQRVYDQRNNTPYQQQYEPYRVAPQQQQPYPYHLQPPPPQRHNIMPPPPNVRHAANDPYSTYQQQQQQQPYLQGVSEPSVVSSEGSAASSHRGRNTNKRESITVADLTTDRKSLEDLTDSFSKMATDQQKMMASSDTMGTIDYQGSMADMSINSSTFSIFRGGGQDSSIGMDVLSTGQQQRTHLFQQQQQQQRMSDAANNDVYNNNTNSSNRPSNARTDSSSTSKSGDSMSFTELLERQGKSSSLSCNVSGLMHDIRKQVESEIQSARPAPEEVVDLVDVQNMRASSLEVMKVLLPTENEMEQQQQQPPPPDAYQQREAYYRQDPNRTSAAAATEEG